MRLTCRLRSLRSVLSPLSQPPARIPTSKYQDILASPSAQTPHLNENKRKLYDMGELIHDIQMSRQFKTSKAFMDTKMKFPFIEVIKRYKHLKLTFGPNKIPPPFVLLKFLRENFEPSDDMESWSPPDWVPMPKVVESIKDPVFQKFAEEVNSLWQKLGRKMNPSVSKGKDMYSIVPVPHGFILNSSELKEMYYWDSYWIVRGLLACDMTSTAKGIIQNLISLLDQYNYVPASNRIYHTDHSQIPLLILMVNEYVTATGELDFVKDNIHVLEKEMIFWRNHRSLPVTSKNVTYSMYRYFATTRVPRPEHYRSDYKYMSSQVEAPSILSGLKSAEESCWHLSSRWLDHLGHNEGSVYNIKTHDMIPVDLNAVMYKNYRILAEWFRSLGDEKKTGLYTLLAEELLMALDNVLWQEKLGYWCDYNFNHFSPRTYHYLSNLTPLWTDSHQKDKRRLSEHALAYISNQKLYRYRGGVPVSLEFGGEVWDFPSVQPTVLATLLEGLASLGTEEATGCAILLAETWLDAAMTGLAKHGVIYDRYDALSPGETSYPDENEPPAIGYGSTIGIIMLLFSKWPDKLKSTISPQVKKSNPDV